MITESLFLKWVFLGFVFWLPSSIGEILKSTWIDRTIIQPITFMVKFEFNYHSSVIFIMLVCHYNNLIWALEESVHGAITDRWIFFFNLHWFFFTSSLKFIAYTYPKLLLYLDKGTASVSGDAKQTMVSW